MFIAVNSVPTESNGGLISFTYLFFVIDAILIIHKIISQNGETKDYANFTVCTHLKILHKNFCVN